MTDARQRLAGMIEPLIDAGNPDTPYETALLIVDNLADRSDDLAEVAGLRRYSDVAMDKAKSYRAGQRETAGKIAAALYKWADDTDDYDLISGLDAAAVFAMSFAGGEEET